MSDASELSCRCGQVKARLARQDRMHIACFCKYCRGFAKLKGDSADLLPGGGVEMMQSSIDRLVIDNGAANLGCMQFSEKGPLRWYATCCDAPLWLSLPNPGVGHLSVPTTRAVARADFGPVRSNVNTGGATGAIEGRSEIGTPRVILSMVWRILRARFRGAAKGSPLYDASTKAPVVASKVMSKEERAAALA